MDLHALAEARSLALHREALSRIERQPELLEQVRARLAAWTSDDSKPQRYVQTWAELLDDPSGAWRSAMIGEDERCIALRQATPFAGIADPRTRWRIWSEVRERVEARR